MRKMKTQGGRQDDVLLVGQANPGIPLAWASRCGVMRESGNRKQIDPPVPTGGHKAAIGYRLYSRVNLLVPAFWRDAPKVSG